ncbi:hypothetical protein [Geminocystis sp. NIES-3709]|uniref:hypothetical protein n=1 Tax=Geminocystis sp. NIES-3709 TaxID=1617448 RepID=UPI0005FCBFF4|nr:hypothetical protein [Geminocystis sp. NIES-3709]BAQ63893.1 Methyl-accepting chemotaxis protein [Geminocystis sp. NIES-3709]
MKKYLLEYWIDSNKYSKAELENKFKNQSKFKQYIDDNNLIFNVSKNKNYLVLSIHSTNTIIEKCRANLNFDRQYCFIVKDELADFVRLEAYPLLAEIELTLRHFINEAMINVFGFDWWSLFIPNNTQKKIQNIENNEIEDYVNLQHPISFSFFDDLIGIFTTKIQKWTPDSPIKVADLDELLSTSNDIKKLRQEIKNRQKTISFWDDVFSYYFEDQDSWKELEKILQNFIIPARNRVMHYRLIALYELNKIKEFRDKLKHIINSAKTKLSDTEKENINMNAKTIIDKLIKQMNSQIIPPIPITQIIKPMNISIIPPIPIAQIIKPMNISIIPPIPIAQIIKPVDIPIIPPIPIEKIINSNRQISDIVSQYQENMKKINDLQNQFKINNDRKPLF